MSDWVYPDFCNMTPVGFKFFYSPTLINWSDLIDERANMLGKTQKEILEWTRYNFPDTNAMEQFLGVVEEVGELSHVILKDQQGIRDSADDEYDPVPDMQDAVGDILIYLINFCNQMQWDVSSILARTWEQVQERDWQEDPEGPKQVVMFFNESEDDE